MIYLQMRKRKICALLAIMPRPVLGRRLGASALYCLPAIASYCLPVIKKCLSMLAGAATCQSCTLDQFDSSSGQAGPPVQLRRGLSQWLHPVEGVLPQLPLTSCTDTSLYINLLNHSDLLIYYFVMIGLLYNGCQHRFTDPAEAKALPHEGPSALVIVSL